MKQDVVLVIGATGAQGGGLAHAILNDPDRKFALRVIARNPSSEKAASLAAKGAEVVAGDVDDADSLKRAFDGAQAAFCVTFYWNHFSPEKELGHATSMAQAAKAAGTQHVIWSTLEDTRRFVPLDDNRMPTLMGKYKVPHFDAKGEADNVFRGLGVPTTFLLTSFYWDNYLYFGMGPKPGPDGVLAITMPMGDRKLPGIAAEDIGKCAYGILKRRADFLGKTVGICGEQLTGAEMAAALTQALGREVRYNDVPPEVYRAFGFPGADDLGNMFQFKRDFNDVFCGARDVKLSRELNPELQSFAQWLERNKARIPDIA
jgi:uncharacterized protein YbjT (DUF2867 family)